MRMLFVGDGAV